QTAYFDKVVFCVGSSAQTRNFNSFDLLKDFKINLTKRQASLTPVKTQKVWLPLNGVKTKCNVTLYQNGQRVMSENGEVLFRDYVLSGIVIFNVSAYIARNIAKGVDAKYYVSLDLFDEITQKRLEEKLFERFAVSQFLSLLASFFALLSIRLFIISKSASDAPIYARKFSICSLDLIYTICEFLRVPVFAEISASESIARSSRASVSSLAGISR
ncbi:MAG: NAD(P)/FAD-dependent oxidoreductase, partial [Clostridia bacterium]|nr:NAD(P)/FAD-dependent oxidoreductase [Clostridia bacterium]